MESWLATTSNAPPEPRRGPREGLQWEAVRQAYRNRRGRPTLIVTIGTARETFEQAARASRRLPTIDAELAALDDAWSRGEWVGAGIASGWHSDPTASRAGYRAAARDRLRAERDELAEVVAETTALVDGLALLLGAGYCSALKYRYLENRPWAEVAELLGCCEKTAHNRVSVALDTIDALGPARVRQAHGVAEL